MEVQEHINQMDIDVDGNASESNEDDVLDGNKPDGDIGDGDIIDGDDNEIDICECDIADYDTEAEAESDLDIELENDVELENEETDEVDEIEEDEELENDTDLDTNICAHIICWPVPPTQKDKCYTLADPYLETECPGGIPASCGNNPALAGCGQETQYPGNHQTLTCYNSSGIETSRESLPTPSDNEIVTDLTWQSFYVTEKTWQQALAYCEELEHGTYSDWRLPSI